MQTEKNVVSSQDKGATLVEYALLVALIAVASIAAMQLLATKVSSKFSSIGSSLQ
jgi:pilus assembly protein Flp/PilA